MDIESCQSHPQVYIRSEFSLEIDLGEGTPPLVITQNGEAKAVIQDVASYAATQELLALLKLLAMARDDMATGRVQPLQGLKERIRKRAAQ